MTNIKYDHEYPTSEPIENKGFIVDSAPYRRDLFTPETSFERAERAEREFRRLWGTGHDSIAAAMTWADARIARKVRRKTQHA